MAKPDDCSEFRATLGGAAPPHSAGAELQALWWQRNGDWDRAHRIVQALNTASAACVHAYLHRVEGDLENAAYWYRRAAQPVCVDPLESEWDALVTRFDAQ
jgi:hypothetical protein